MAQLMPMLVTNDRSTACISEWNEDDEDELQAYAAQVAAEETRPVLTESTIQLIRAAREYTQQAMDTITLPDMSGGSTASKFVDSRIIAWTPGAQGITLIELFGGICTGLEAVLKCGMRVDRYFYCDIHPVAQLIAQQRIEALQQEYPTQFTGKACSNTFCMLPQDVCYVQQGHIQQLGHVDLVIAGWPCQGFSSAGQGQGLADAQSGLFVDLVQIMNWIQELNPQLRVHL